MEASLSNVHAQCEDKNKLTFSGLPVSVKQTAIDKCGCHQTV